MSDTVTKMARCADVIDGGAFTLVQDAGRWGHQDLGVPVSGPMDPYAFRAANALVGNGPTDAMLEITLAGPRLSFDGECFVAVTGGDLGFAVNDRGAAMWQAHHVHVGDSIGFGGRASGARAYLAVSGGIVVPPWLGSRATYVRGGVGGLHGRALRRGDRLPIGSIGDAIRRVPARALSVDALPPYSAHPELRVILGPYGDRFSARGIETLLSTTFTVSAQSDRMGYRLEGPRIEFAGSPDISSCGIPLGGIQVPGSGTPILLMADHQTAGGYPLIAGVIQADIPLAAQCLPGDEVRFRAVELDEAYRALRQLYGRLDMHTKSLFATI